MKPVGIAFLVSLAIVLAACTGTSNKFSRVAIANDAKGRLVGMQKSDILTCMGTPARTAALSDVEVWTYLSGGDSTSAVIAQGQGTGGGALITGSGWTSRRYCEIDIIFSDEIVNRVNYRGRTGGLLTQGEQCAFAVAPCVEQ